MVTVQYQHEFPYTYVGEYDDYFPILTLRMTNPRQSEQSLDIDGYLDSGAKRSLFDGWIAATLGFDLFSGPKVTHGSSTGFQITGHLHQVRFFHPALGSFDLEISFSTVEISRNLIGRDFFNLVQVGFREKYLTFYLTPTP